MIATDMVLELFSSSVNLSNINEENMTREQYMRLDTMESMFLHLKWLKEEHMNNKKGYQVEKIRQYNTPLEFICYEIYDGETVHKYATLEEASNELNINITILEYMRYCRNRNIRKKRYKECEKYSLKKARYILKDNDYILDTYL